MPSWKEEVERKSRRKREADPAVLFLKRVLSLKETDAATIRMQEQASDMLTRVAVIPPEEERYLKFADLFGVIATEGRETVDDDRQRRLENLQSINENMDVEEAKPVDIRTGIFLAGRLMKAGRRVDHEKVNIAIAYASSGAGYDVPDDLLIFDEPTIDDDTEEAAL